MRIGLYSLPVWIFTSESALSTCNDIEQIEKQPQSNERLEV